MISLRNKVKSMKGITLIALVITIIVLIILASISIYLSLGNNGIFNKAKEAKDKTNKQEATDIINLKITTAQMNKYAEKQVMPTLQELADVLYEDNEIEYVALERKVADKEKITVGDNNSIYTKLNKYPYEFEINSSLQLASIDGIRVSDKNDNTITISKEEYENLKPKSITNDSLLLEATNKNKNIGTFDLSTFTNTFGSTFENYFSFDTTTGKLTCKKSGWYFINVLLEIDSSADPASISTLSCCCNDIETFKVKVYGHVHTVQGTDSNSMTVFLNVGDTLDFKKATVNRAAYWLLNGYVKIFKL